MQRRHVQVGWHPLPPARAPLLGRLAPLQARVAHVWAAAAPPLPATMPAPARMPRWQTGPQPGGGSLKCCPQARGWNVATTWAQHMTVWTPRRTRVTRLVVGLTRVQSMAHTGAQRLRLEVLPEHQKAPKLDLGPSVMTL